MPFLELLFLAVGLSADAFAVSVAAGSAGTASDRRSMLRLSFHFGFFQFMMPIVGWLAGLSIVSYVESLDHWVAFGLLAWVAFRMIHSAMSDEGSSFKQDPSRGKMLVILSFATSIDALAIGLSLAILRISIWYPSIVIGIVTGTTSFMGIFLGKKLSKKFGKRTAIFGAILLLVIGIRILLEHYSVI
jgi:manganese efflux pump family protein